jgi:hypothetical protein
MLDAGILAAREIGDVIAALLLGALLCGEALFDDGLVALIARLIPLRKILFVVDIALAGVFVVFPARAFGGRVSGRRRLRAGEALGLFADGVAVALGLPQLARRGVDFA